MFRCFFDKIVERCIEAGLVWGRELYFDATKVEANASLDSVKPRFAVEAHLAELFTDRERMAEAQRNPSPEMLPIGLPEADRQGLAEANTSRHDWIVEEGRQDRDVAHGHYQRIADFQASETDPDATPMRSDRGLDLGYHDHYAVDGGKARIILACLVTPSEVMENQPMLDILWRSCFRWKLHPSQVTGDT